MRLSLTSATLAENRCLLYLGAIIANIAKQVSLSG